MQNMTKISRGALFSVCLVVYIHLACPALFSTDASAAIFKYTNEEGRTVFVDDESKIPPRFRKDADKYKEKYDHLSYTERNKIYEQEYEKQEAEETLEKLKSALEKQVKKQQELTMPVTIRGNQVVVPVNIKRRGRTATLQLVLDTGATNTVLYKSRVERLDLRSARRINGRLAGGQEVKADIVTLDKLEVGPFNYGEVQVVLLADEGRHDGTDGLLGMDVLRNHTYRIDFDNSVIIWND